MRNRADGGFTLIEVLIAVFVLAVGIVGAARIHIAALRTRHESSLMSNAVQLASGLADRMRANVVQMRQADGANPYLSLHYDAALEGAPAPPASLCYAGFACDSGQLADFDLYEIRQALYAGFPGARIVVCRDSQAWDPGRHALTWACSGGAADPIMVKLGWLAKNPDGSEHLDSAGQLAPAIAIPVEGAPT